jgi:hypothetical protein
MRETLKQFIDRGGKINKIEGQETPNEKHVLPVRLTGSMDLMDLADGAELYSEAAMSAKYVRKVKLTSKVKKIKINKDLLPSNLLNLLDSLETQDAEKKKEVIHEGE